MKYKYITILIFIIYILTLFSCGYSLYKKPYIYPYDLKIKEYTELPEHNKSLKIDLLKKRTVEMHYGFDQKEIIPEEFSVIYKYLESDYELLYSEENGKLLIFNNITYEQIPLINSSGVLNDIIVCGKTTPVVFNTIDYLYFNPYKNEYLNNLFMFPDEKNKGTIVLSFIIMNKLTDIKKYPDLMTEELYDSIHTELKKKNDPMLLDFEFFYYKYSMNNGIDVNFKESYPFFDPLTYDKDFYRLRALSSASKYSYNTINKIFEKYGFGETDARNHMVQFGYTGEKEPVCILEANINFSQNIPIIKYNCVSISPKGFEYEVLDKKDVE